MDDALISVSGLWKKYPRSLEAAQRYALRDSFSELVDRRRGEGLREEEAWVLRDVGFEVRRGECLGVIGPNGAGKTTLLRVLAGLIKPDRGRVMTRGRVERLIGLGGGFEPLLSGRENVRLQASLMGVGGRDLDRMLDEVVAFSELDESIDSPVQFYSSGMRARLGFATSAMTRPDVLLLDEITAVGDLRFRIKCYDRIREMAGEAAVVFVSHSMPQVRRLCTTACYLEKGIVALRGDVNDVVECYEESVGRYVGEPSRKAGSGTLPIAVYAGRRLLADNHEIARGASIRVAVDTGAISENVRLRVAVSAEQAAAADAMCVTRPVRSAGGVIAVNLGPVTLPDGACRVTVHLLSPDGMATIARADPVPLIVADAVASPDAGTGDGCPAFDTWNGSQVADAAALPVQLAYDPDSDDAGEEGLASGQPCLRPMQFIDPELDARLATRMERYRTDRLTGITAQDFRKRIERFLQGVDFAMEGYDEHELDRQRDLSIKFHWGHNHDFGPFSLSGRLGDRHIRLLRNFICAFPVTEESLSGLRILDVGCWTGGTTLMLAALGARVTGIEEVKKYADVAGFLARSFGTGAEVLQTSVYDLSSPLEFDLIYYPGVVYHVSDPVLSLRILYNATRMGGAILVESAGVNAAGSLCHYEGCKVFRKGAKEDLNRGGWNWFIPSPLALARMMWMAGYDDIRMMWISGRLYGYGRKLAQNPITRAGLSRRTVS